MSDGSLSALLLQHRATREFIEKKLPWESDLADNYRVELPSPLHIAVEYDWTFNQLRENIITILVEYFRQNGSLSNVNIDRAVLWRSDVKASILRGMNERLYEGSLIALNLHPARERFDNLFNVNVAIEAARNNGLEHLIPSISEHNTFAAYYTELQFSDENVRQEHDVIVRDCLEARALAFTELLTIDTRFLTWLSNQERGLPYLDSLETFVNVVCEECQLYYHLSEFFRAMHIPAITEIYINSITIPAELYARLMNRQTWMNTPVDVRNNILDDFVEILATTTGGAMDRLVPFTLFSFFSTQGENNRTFDPLEFGEEIRKIDARLTDNEGTYRLEALSFALFEAFVNKNESITKQLHPKLEESLFIVDSLTFSLDFSRAVFKSRPFLSMLNRKSINELRLSSEVDLFFAEDDSVRVAPMKNAIPSDYRALMLNLVQLAIGTSTKMCVVMNPTHFASSLSEIVNGFYERFRGTYFIWSQKTSQGRDFYIASVSAFEKTDSLRDFNNINVEAVKEALLQKKTDENGKAVYDLEDLCTEFIELDN